jgi:hypothetical protein
MKILLTILCILFLLSGLGLAQETVPFTLPGNDQVALLATITPAYTVAGGLIVYDAAKSGITYQAASSPTVSTPAKNHAIGDLLVVIVAWYESATTISTLNDTAGNSWSHVGVYGVGGVGAIDLYYTKATVGNATNVITATWSTSASYANISVLAFTGEASSPYNNFANGTGTASTGQVTNDATTSAGLMVAGFYEVGNNSFMQGSGFTLGPQGTYFGTEYKIATLSGSQHATIDYGASSQYIAVHGTFN